MEDAGAAAVAVHGRTAAQFYSGCADWDVIARVKAAVEVPVIGNGDIDCAESAADMYRRTGCDLVMVGRGSYGNPWIFSQIESYFENGIIPPEPTLEERLEAMYHQTELAVSFKGEHTAMAEARRECAFYLKGIKGAASYRSRCGSLASLADLKALIEEIRKAEGIC